MNDYNYYGLVYLLRNKINGKCYIGQTSRTLEIRFKSYKYGKCKSQTRLYCALKKYGWDNFHKELLCYAENQEELNQKEVHCINIFNSIKAGYNLREGGSNGQFSDESKLKMSLSQKGKVKSDETQSKTYLRRI